MDKLPNDASGQVTKRLRVIHDPAAVKKAKNKGGNENVERQYDA